MLGGIRKVDKFQFGNDQFLSLGFRFIERTKLLPPSLVGSVPTGGYEIVEPRPHHGDSFQTKPLAHHLLFLN
jgi:hypothetical protein